MKLTLAVLLISLTALFSGCASKATAPTSAASEPTKEATAAPAVKAEYEGHCAMGVCSGNFKAQGNPAITLEHDGKTYYFSDEAQKATFQKKLQKNIKRADAKWHKFISRGGTHGI